MNNTMGITWSVEKVSRNGAEMHGDAQIPIVTDLDAAIKYFGAEAITGSLDGSSWRVMAQDVCRRMLPNRPTADALRDAIVNRLKGVRNTSVRSVREVKVYHLPNGATWSGTDLVEYQQTFIAAMVDGGVPSEIAIAMAAKLAL